MSDDQWSEFFSLVEKIVRGEPGQTWEEKRDTLAQKARDQSAEVNLQEMIGWFDDQDV